MNDARDEKSSDKYVVGYEGMKYEMGIGWLVSSDVD